MRKPEEVRYPSSINLFNFCRRVLNDRYGGMRVIDQDVGGLLDFDPADCSHWKNGKKSIKTIQAIQDIAKKLSVDERLILDVAHGALDDEEAYLEYSGYGDWKISSEIADNTVRELYRIQAASWSKQKESDIRAEFTTKLPEVLNIVGAIHATIGYETAPLYLPEILTKFSYISFEHVDPAKVPEVGTSFSEVKISDTACALSFVKGQEVKPFMRFQLALHMGRFFLGREGLLPSESLLGVQAARYITNVRCSLFAAHLLAPDHILRKELQTVNPASDVISQLAENFWVSKKFMNQRLQLMFLG